MPEIQVSNADCDNVHSFISDPDSDYNDQEYLVLNPEKENFAVEFICNEEDKGMDSNVFSSLEQSLIEEVIQSVHEKQDEIFVQVSETVLLDEFMVDDRDIMFEHRESPKVAFLMIDECNEEHDNLTVISYEDDLQYIHTVEDQNIPDCF